MKLPVKRGRSSFSEDGFGGLGSTYESLVLCKLLWFAAAWLPGVLFFPFNWLLEAPMFSVISRSDEELSRRMMWFSSSVVIPLLSFAVALFLYPSGQARLLHLGPELQAQSRLDPYTRLHSGSAGRSVHGITLLRQIPNNAAIYLMRTLTGPPPSAYSGPFPSLSESLAVLSGSGSQLSLASFYSDRFRLGREEVQLEAGSARAILQFAGLPDEEIGALQAGLYRGDCLVVGIQQGERLSRIVLADRTDSQPFNVYVVPARQQSLAPGYDRQSAAAER